MLALAITIFSSNIVLAASENNISLVKTKVDDFMSEDEARELAELREKWQLDYDSSISYATKKGYEEGFAAGIADGHAEGRAEGQAEEREKSEEKIRNIAKKLLQKNNDLQDIIDITGLDKSEILKLKK